MTIACRDCQHYRVVGDDFERAEICVHEESRAYGAIDAVSGRAPVLYKKCRAMRAGLCGTDATLFKQATALRRLRALLAA